MTKRKLGCALMALGLAVSAEAAEIKIGVVNVPQLLEKAPQAEQARKELEREFAPREKKLAAEAKEIKALEERLGKDAAVMSDSERDRTEKDLMSRRRDAKRAQDEFREDISLRRNEVLTQLQKSILEAIQSIAKEDGYDLLLTEGVVYASEGIDVTSKVESRLESGYKGSKK